MRKKPGELQEVFRRAFEIKKKEPDLTWSAIAIRLGCPQRTFGSCMRRWAKNNHFEKELESVDKNKYKKIL